MPYIGRELDSGNYLKLDDISSSFNGSTTTFNLTAAGKAFFPGSAFSILVNLAGVAQEPESAYQINNATITFATAPVAGDQFFCIVLGVAHGINVPGNGTVNGAQLAKPFNYDGYFYLDDANNRVGVGTATPQKPLHVVGEGQFDSVRILGDLTVDGSTTTLDTVVTEVDKLEVGANNSTVGVAITQSGSGDILNLYDGATEVFSVADGGDVSIVDKIIHTGDTNTAIRFPADDTVTVETAGTERFRVTSAGNVGIGTADPQRKLSIKDSGNTFISIENLSNATSGLIGANSSGLTLISRDTQGGSTAKPIQFITGSTEKVRISSTGRVGIGTIDPQSQFEVFGSSPVVRSKNTSNQTYTEISNDGTDGYVDWSSGGLIFRGASNTEKLRITSAGLVGIGTDNPSTNLHLSSGAATQLTISNTSTSMSDGDTMGTIDFSAGSSNTVNARVAGAVEGTSEAGGDLVFETRADGGSLAEKLRITSAGLVGIGTDNPQRDLVVYKPTSDSILSLAASSTEQAIVLFGDSDNDAIGQIRYDNTDNSMAFRVNISERLRITSSGDVGIGTDNPSAKLEVSGDARVTGILTVGQSSVTIDGTNSRIITPKLDYSAISSSISDTATDIFVYDTTKDSDGGAWRKRTQHTSWYNETLNTSTRGSRKEFPSVAVIVTTATNVKIYDGDDPDMPMWMDFQSGSYYFLGPTNRIKNSAHMLNGILCVTKKGSISWMSYISFIDDRANQYSDNDGEKRDYLVPITYRNSNNVNAVVNSIQAYTIVNDATNDVSMTVLPNAPIDDATGLPVPTIAVGTDGGASIIRDDGTVADITITTGSNNDGDRVDFTDDNRIVIQWGGDSAGEITIDEIPSADISANYPINLPGSHYNDNSPANYSPIFLTEGPSLSNRHPTAISQFRAVGTTAALSLFDENKESEEDGMVAFISSSYNTGYQQGRIKGAFLSDTDTTNVVGTELVTNGTFDSNTTDWTARNGATVTHTTPSAESIDSPATDGRATPSSAGIIKMVSAGGGSGAYQSFTTVVGKTYTASFLAYQVTYGSNYVYIGTTDNGNQNVDFYDEWDQSVANNWASGSATFTATATTTYITLIPSQVSGRVLYMDQISVRLANPDRSVNNKGLQVFGTVTKSAVATGAELVGYSGWSSSNHLRQPYNSDLNFGTGDFYFCGWFKGAGYSDVLMGRLHDSSSAGKGFLLSTSSSNGGGVLTFAIYTSGFQSSGRTTVNSTTDETGKGWQQVWGIRRSGTMELWISGNLVNTGSNTADISDTTYSPPVFIGDRYGDGAFDGELALIRMGASAPSAEQIKKIYEDEKVLFQENAKATLYGSSDAVTALAYDDTTELLHVGTSAGRSDFRGLRRINNTTTAVTTAISAQDDLIAEQ